MELSSDLPEMNLGKYIFGIREEHFRKVPDDERSSQFYSYNLLAAMFFVLSGLTVAAGVCYGLVIFKSWWLAAGLGLILGGISFILLLLVLFLNMTTDYQGLYAFMTNMNPIFDRHNKENFAESTDDELLELVSKNEAQLRQEHLTPDDAPIHFSSVLVSVIKLVLILILSCVVANGLEMLMFKNKINASMRSIHVQLLEDKSKMDVSESPLTAEAQWTIEMLDEQHMQPFLLIDCHSLLMTNDILSTALGPWKVILDMLFYGLFLIPFVLVRKSRQYAGGEFLREVAIIDISTSYLSYLITQRKCQQIQKEIRNNWDYDQLLRQL